MVRSVPVPQVQSRIENQKRKPGTNNCIHCQSLSCWYMWVSIFMFPEAALGLVCQMKWPGFCRAAALRFCWMKGKY